MRLRRGGGVNMFPADPTYLQSVRNKRTVTSPFHSFRAHDGDTFFRGGFDQDIESLAEIWSLHVVGISTEGFVPPGRVDRVCPRVAQTAQFRHVPVLNARVLQTAGQNIAIELRVMARPGNGTNIN